MLTYQYLVDSIGPKRPVETKEFNFSKYVDIHKAQTEPTSSELVNRVKDQFYTAHSGVETGAIDKIWNFIKPRVEQNAGLAEFILDYDGARSRYFFPWLINIFRSPATALEMSYGAGPDVSGEWNDDILTSDPDDPLVPFILDDPAFVYNRERQLFTADLATSVQEAAWSANTCAKIIDFGAGRLAWIRRHGFDLTSNFHEIYAFDKDPSIDPTKLLDGDLLGYNIKYKHGDFTAQFTNPDCKDADLIILGGVVSYIPPEVFAEKIVPAIYGLLVENGIFFFDLQTETPCYRHSMDILDWPEIILPDTPSKVIDYAEDTRKALWAKGLRFNAQYNVDTYNKIPSAVMVTLQKI